MSETPPENMSVSELREWLKTFGKKQQDHFQHNQIKRRSPTKKISTGGFSSVRDRLSQLEQNDINEENSQQENDRPETVTRRVAFHPHNATENQRPSEINRQVPTIQDDSFQLEEPPVKAQYDTTKYSTKVDERSSDFTTMEEDYGNQDFVEQESGELPEAPSVEHDLCLTLSAVSMLTSSFSMEVEGSKCLESDASLETFNAKEDSEQLTLEQLEHGNDEPAVVDSLAPMQRTGQKPISPVAQQLEKHEKVESSIADHLAFSAQEPLKGFSVCKAKSPFRPQPMSVPNSAFPKQQLRPKAVPAAWSDLDPIEFSASEDSVSSGEKDKSPELDRSTWDNCEARQFLQRQSITDFQGHWSDSECDDENSAAGSLRSEPSRLRAKNSRRKLRNKGRRNSLSGLETSTIFEDEPVSGLTLFGAAQASVARKPSSGPRSLSDFFSANVDSAMSKETAAAGTGMATNQSMHNANLFQNNTMTASALDAICKTGKTTQRSRGSLDTFFARTDQDSSCSWSEDSRTPSIAPNAVDANLSKVLSQDSDNTYPTTDCSYEQRQPSQTEIAVSKDIRQEAPSPKYAGKPKVVIEGMLKAKVGKTASEKGSSTGSFSSVIQKFGGGGRLAARKTRIERQKEALEKKWQENRKVKKHVRKTKWQVVSGISGVYKKRVVLDKDES